MRAMVPRLLKRSWIWLPTTLLLAGLATFSLIYQRSVSAKFAQLRVGMTVEEVEAILGTQQLVMKQHPPLPPRLDREGQLLPPPFQPGLDGDVLNTLYGFEDASISATFRDGKLVSKRCYPISLRVRFQKAWRQIKDVLGF
jgi:hypothetical protein